MRVVSQSSQHGFWQAALEAFEQHDHLYALLKVGAPNSDLQMKHQILLGGFADDDSCSPFAFSHWSQLCLLHEQGYSVKEFAKRNCLLERMRQELESKARSILTPVKLQAALIQYAGVISLVCLWIGEALLEWKLKRTFLFSASLLMTLGALWIDYLSHRFQSRFF